MERNPPLGVQAPPGSRVRQARSTWNEPRGLALSGSGPADAASALEKGLRELGLATSAAQRQTLLGLTALLERWNRRVNLTAHRSQDAIVRRLVLDAAALSQALPPAASIADLGSGAGFPGLALAVLRPGCAVWLVEARERRVHFQRAAIRELGIEGVEALRGRIEDLEPHPADIALAQALARPSQALRLLLPWARPGGFVAIPGAERAPQLAPSPEIARSEVRTYRVPLGGPQRTLWLGTRSR